ncbi:hypothetical protein PTKIN_Ptkin14bG0117900 [Pterospermum kingtungense]
MWTRIAQLNYPLIFVAGQIPFQLGNLPKWEDLYLGSNSISAIIPPRIFNSSTIRNIVLTLNRFSGYLPSSIGPWLPKLERLEFGGNQLSGPIPASISNASRHTFIDIVSNSFSGYIPIELGNLRDLQWLNLENNGLISTVSSSDSSFLSSLANCKHLRFLAFDRNPMIKGTLPVSIGNLSVQEFVAFGCHIEGRIPGEIGNLSNLINLNLDNNELTGAIPTTIGRLINLRSLSLQDNKLEGSLPIELCHLKSLGFLYFTNNKLGGQLPACLVGSAILVAVVFIFSRRRKTNSNLPNDQGNLRATAEWRRVSFQQLYQATDGFSDSKLLGAGSFGSVYRGTLSDGLNIMIDVASGLEYLHHGYTTPVIHCDLKPNNVLLDENMVAHLGDFGIAKMLGEEDSVIRTMTLATIGYMAPEYGSEGIVSSKCDVYSFGILSMETITRKKPTDEIFAGEMNLKYWVKKSLPSALMEVVDTNLLNDGERRYSTCTRDCAFSILQLALECSEEVPEERLGMKEVVAKLKKIKVKFLKDKNRNRRAL